MRSSQRTNTLPTEPRRLILGVARDCNINIAVRTEEYHRVYIGLTELENIRDRGRMSEIQKELNTRLAKCIKRETGIDLLDSEVASNLSIEENALIQEVGFSCAVNAFRRIAKKKFMKWIEEEYQKLDDEATKVAERVVRFGSKVGDPVDVFNQLTLLSRIIENIVEDFDVEEVLSDPSAVLRLLLISYLGELRSQVSMISLRPLLFTVGLAQLSVDKDMSWSTSVIALTIEEQLVKKRAKEFGIEIQEKEKYYSILKKVNKYLEEKGIRQSREILLADGHREIRNKVLHENWSPTEDEMDDIIAHVLKITQFFSSSNMS